MREIKIYNTLSRKKEIFKPIIRNHVGMYVCGPTVYDYSHLGHGRTYIAFDMIRRYLEHKNYIVKLVINFTDIDDKIIKRSREERIPWHEVAQKYINSYEEDMRALNVKSPPISQG